MEGIVYKLTHLNREQKTMRKLLSTEQVDAVANRTDGNDHWGARLLLTHLMGWADLHEAYERAHAKNDTAGRYAIDSYMLKPLCFKTLQGERYWAAL